MGRPEKRHRYAGKLRTVKEISEMTGYTIDHIYKRLARKKPITPKPPKRISTKIPHATITYTSNGETHTAKEWAEITGLHVTTIYEYIKSGRTLELGIMNPPVGRKKAFCVKDYHFPEIDDETMMEIACAVVQQAADDWHYLCNGGKETQDCNFVELTDFFTNELPHFGLSKETAQDVWEIMQKEREGVE